MMLNPFDIPPPPERTAEESALIRMSEKALDVLWLVLSGLIFIVFAALAADQVGVW